MNKKNEYEGGMVENVIFARNVFWAMASIVIFVAALTVLALVFGG